MKRVHIYRPFFRFGFFAFVLLFLQILPSASLAQQTPTSPSNSIAEEQDYAFAYGLYSDGLYQLASDQFEKFIMKYSNSIKQVDAQFLRIECSFHQEQYDAAAKGFLQFVHDYPSSQLTDNAYFRLGETYLKLNRFDDAIGAFKSVLDQFEEGELAGEAAYWIGETSVRKEEYDGALKYYTLAYEHYPNNRLRDYALYSIAWTEQKRGEFSKAADSYRSFIETFPKSSLTMSARVRIGECYYYLKDYQRAIDELTASKPNIERPEEKGEADYLIGESYYHLDQFNKAQKQYEDFLVAYPDHKLAREVTYALGWTDLKLNNFAAAATEFGRLADGTDELAHAALYRKGVAQKFAGQRDSARATFNEVFARNPQGEFSDNAIYDAALLRFEDQKYAEARKLLERVPKEYPTGDVLTDACRMIGECFIHEANYDEARAAFEKALAQPNAPFDVKVAASFQLGWCSFKLKNYQEAAIRFSSFLQLYGEHPRANEAKFWLAESEYQLGNYSSSLKNYQAVAAIPGHERREDALYGVAWSLYKLNEFSKAIDAFEGYITTYPNGKFAFDARLRLGDSYFFLKDYRKAAGAYRAVIRLYPNRDQIDYAYYQLGQTHYRAGEQDLALQQFSALIKSYPKSSLADDAQYALGWIHFQQEEYLEAIKEFQKLISTYPDGDFAPRGYYSIGDAYYNLKQYAPAEKAYREVLKRFPRSPYTLDAVTGIQYCLVAQGKQREALEVIDGFVRENPGSDIVEALYLKKGDLLYNQGQYAEAAAAYRLFTDRYSKSKQVPTALFWLGKSYHAQERSVDAAQAFERAANSASATQKLIGEALLEAAKIYLKQKEFDRVFSLVSRIEKELPESEVAPEAAYMKGEVYVENGDLTEARNQFEFLASRFGKTVAADKGRVALIRIPLKNHDDVAAQALAQQVATHRTDEIGAEAQYLSGVAYAESKDWQNAVTAFLRVRYIFPSYETWLAKAYLGLGTAYEQLQDIRKAREAYQNVLKFHKEQDAIAEANRRLKAMDQM